MWFHRLYRLLAWRWLGVIIHKRWRKVHLGFYFILFSVFRKRCHTCKLRHTRLLLTNSGEVHHSPGLWSRPLHSVPVLIHGVFHCETMPVTIIHTGKTRVGCGCLLVSSHVIQLLLYYLLRHRGLGGLWTTWVICPQLLQTVRAG